MKFYIIDPALCCSDCQQPFSETCLALWRQEAGDDSLPEICDECAELEVLHDRQLRYA